MGEQATTLEQQANGLKSKLGDVEHGEDQSKKILTNLEAAKHTAEKRLSAEKQAEADAASHLEQQKAKATASQAAASDEMAVAQEAHTTALEVKQKLQVELDASHAQTSEADLAATIASTTTHAAKTKTQEAIFLSTKKQQEAAIARQRADDAHSIFAEKEASMKLQESKVKDVQQMLQHAQDQLTQDEEAQKASAQEYFEAATEAGAMAKKASKASESVARAQENLKTVGAEPVSTDASALSYSVQALVDIGQQVIAGSSEIQELGI